MDHTHPHPDSFAETLDGARRDETWAFDSLFARMSGRLLAFFQARGTEDAEAATSEVMLRVFRTVHTFEGDESDFGSWVFTIATRLAIDEHRKAERRPRLSAVAVPDRPAIEDPAAETVDRLATAAELRSMLEELTPHQRDVVILRVVVGLTAEQVARITESTPDAVRAAQHRGLSRLREVFRGLVTL